MDEGNLAVVGRFQNTTVAHLARMALEAQGIDAVITGDLSERLFGTSNIFGLRRGTTGIALRVRPEDAEEAMRILDAIEAGEEAEED